jgi:hypothetical protein
MALAGLAILLAACSGSPQDALAQSGSTTTKPASVTTCAPGSTASTSTLPTSSTATVLPATTTTTTPTTGTTAPGSNALTQADQFTACMRAHGVDFPDPTVVNGQIEFNGAPGLGRTQGFVSAQQTCSESVYGSAPVQGGGAG